MRRWVLPLILLITLGVLIGWRLRTKKEEAAMQTKQRAARMTAPPVVSVALVRVRDISHTFQSVGTVEAPFNVKIASKITGRIDYLVVREGDRVTHGQVLVRIDPSEVEAAVIEQKAAVAEAQYRLAQAQINQAPTNAGVITQLRQQEAAVASVLADCNQVKESYALELATAEAAVTDTQGRVDSAEAAIGTAEAAMANAEAAVANAEAAIRSAQASLDNARSKHNRIHELYKQGFIAAQDVDDARTAVSVQQSALDAARGQLNAAKAQRASAAAQRNAASAQKNSAMAQKQAAEKQTGIVKAKYKADLASAEARLAQARAALDYAKANTAQKPAYQQNLAALRASVRAVQAALKSAEARRADMVLRSPINGFVTARSMDPGAVATPGQPILTVQSVRDVWATVPVAEEVSRKIRVGLMAQVTFDALPGRTFSGKVVQINPSADPASRQFVVRVLLNNAHNLLKPGMYARVSIVTDRVPAAIVVPREAVQRDKNGPAIYVVNASQAVERRPVTLGVEDVNEVAITQGVKPGEKAVVMSAFPLKEGQKVRIAGGKPGGRPPQGPDREASKEGTSQT